VRRLRALARAGVDPWATLAETAITERADAARSQAALARVLVALSPALAPALPGYESLFSIVFRCLTHRRKSASSPLMSFSSSGFMCAITRLGTFMLLSISVCAQC
jgi:hypothetical protein